MKNLLLAISFLTIIPIGKSQRCDDADFPNMVSYFTLVGFIQGICLIAVDLILGRLFHPDLCIALMLLTYVLINGGFHLDALADTFDALAVRGNKERKLSVMKEGSVGAAGVVSIVFSLSLKYLAIKSISNLLPLVYYASLLLMPVLSKWGMVIALYNGSPARKDGIGSLLIGKIGKGALIFSTLSVLCLMGGLLLAPKIYVPDGLLLFFVFFLFITYIFVRFLISFYKGHFGGLTGDTVGSISEIMEVIFLIMVILWSRLYIW